MDLYQYAYGVGQNYGIPGTLLPDLIGAESNYNLFAVSSTGAQGVAQVLPSTAADPGYGVAPLSNPFDPYAAINFAGAYLKALYGKIGSWSGALLAYNKGLGYAQANPTETPYPGSNALQSDLGNSGMTTVATGSSSSSSSSGGLFGFVGDLVSRAGYILLGLIVIAVGLYLLSK